MATVVVTPDPVPMGETFKVEGIGFDVDSPINLFIDGDQVEGSGYAHHTPDGGVVDFFASIDEPGTHTVGVNQPAGKTQASFDLNVVTGWETEEEEAPAAARTAKKTTAKKDEED